MTTDAHQMIEPQMTKVPWGGSRLCESRGYDWLPPPV